MFPSFIRNNIPDCEIANMEAFCKRMDRVIKLKKLTNFNNFFCRKFCASTIYHLLKSRSPSAIIWGIGTIIINAVNRMSLTWSAPHIFKKIYKRILPSFAYYDPTVLIIFSLNIRRAVTTIFHCTPGRVLFSRLIIIHSSLTMAFSHPNSITRKSPGGYSHRIC